MPRVPKLNLILLCVVVLIALVIAAPLFRRTSATSSPRFLVGVPERGSALFYGSKQCGICHSVSGAGGRLAPDLAGSHPETPAMAWLTTKLWNHGPGMWRQIRQQNKPFPEMNGQEMADILSFLYQAANVDPRGDTRLGKQVFTEKGCSRCHSVGGAGGTAGPDLSQIAIGGDRAEWTRTMLNHAGSMIDPITSTLGKWPQFNGQEMNDLIVYVISASRIPEKKKTTVGDAERGSKVFQGRCMQCHSVRGMGGKLGPELGPEKELPLSTAQFASVMWNHAPAMLQKGRDNKVPAPVLQANDMADMLAYLTSLRYFEPQGTAASGKKIFARRGCASCHGDGAEGTQAGPQLRAEKERYTLASFTAALWRHGPKMIDQVEAMGMTWPKLESNDIGDLVSFLNEKSGKN